MGAGKRDANMDGIGSEHQQTADEYAEAQRKAGLLDEQRQRNEERKQWKNRTIELEPPDEPGAISEPPSDPEGFDSTPNRQAGLDRDNVAQQPRKGRRQQQQPEDGPPPVIASQWNQVGPAQMQGMSGGGGGDNGVMQQILQELQKQTAALDKMAGNNAATFSE